MSSGSCAWLEVTVGRPRVRLRDLTTSLETPPVVRSSTSEGGVPESSIESRAAHTEGWLVLGRGGYHDDITFIRGLAGLLLLHLHHGLGGHGGELVPRHVVDRALHAAAGHAVALVHQDHCSTQQLQGAEYWGATYGDSSQTRQL